MIYGIILTVKSALVNRKKQKKRQYRPFLKFLYQKPFFITIYIFFSLL